MALNSGVRVGPYEILSPLGAGGMGEVYRARDTRLDRDVALKLLPTEVMKDHDRLQRFAREARAASALNHPAIVAIYDLAEADSQPYLAMELVDGQTLRQLLQNGPLPIRRALQIAAPIADGLAKAHEAGIVHRDVKPENLMVSHDGFPKILDFGLARLVGGPEQETALTQTNRGTRPGIAVGTVGYMSPEQAAGAVADNRSDQFAFGLVLYELLTGQRPFSRPTAVETMSAIIRDEPTPVAQLNPAVPAPLQWIVERCLAKSPSDRYGSTRDLARDLAAARDHLSQLTSSGTTAAASAGSATRVGRREFVAWALVATLLIAGVVASFDSRRGAPATAGSVARFTITPPKGVSFAWAVGHSPFALSPDGRQLAFAGLDADRRRRLWLRSFDSFDARPVAGSEGAFGPFWSPDGLSIGFFTPDRLKRVSLSGGDAVVICEASFGGGATWNRDGVIVFAPGIDTVLYRVAAAGGTPTAVTTFDPSSGESAHLGPTFLPDGRHFVFNTVGAAAGIFVGSLDSSERKRIPVEGSVPGFSAPDTLFVVRDRILIAHRMDMNRFDLLGEPVRIAEDVDLLGPSAAFAVSLSGSLIYWTGDRIITQPTWFQRDGTNAGTLGAAAAYVNVALSPDGQRAAVDRFDATPGIWLLDKARGTSTRATFGVKYESTPVWAPDGSAFVFAAVRDSPPNVYLKRPGASSEERLQHSALQSFPQSWSSDGRFVVYVSIDPKSRADLWLLPMFGDRKPTPLIQTPFEERQPRISPDRRWIAYSSNDSGRLNVYVTRFPEPREKWLVSPDGGNYPIWRPDGRELFYRAFDGRLMAVPIAASPDFSPGPPIPLFKPAASISNLGLGTFYDVAPDGRFLINMFVERTSPPASVVLKSQ